MNHTKRTPEFKAKIEALIEKELMSLYAGGDSGIPEIIDILRTHTTDLPCIVKAAEDEPVFVLRGQDSLAALSAEDWARRFGEMPAKTDTAGPHPKYVDARECAKEMYAFSGGRMPD